MIKRPLCLMCLIFLVVQSIILSLSGQSLVEMPASSIFQGEEGQKIRLSGSVYNKKVTSKIQILYLKHNSIDDSKIIVYDSNFENISIGQTIYIEGAITHFDKAHNPGNFDQAAYYAKEGIYGSVFCEKILKVDGEKQHIKESLYELKIKWKRKLIAFLGEENGNIMSAMILGEKSGMNQDIKELYQKNGMGHLLAISGLHVSFIGLGIYKVIRKTGMSYGVSGVLSILMLSLYAMMIGFGVSVFRAYIMLVLKIIADMSGRVYDMLTALMLSAALAVLRQPLYLTDAGFYLSYGAVLGILLLSPMLEKKVPKVMLPGVCVNIALFPIQLWFYYEFPLYSILINLVVIPFMSILLAAGICLMFTGWSVPALLCKMILGLYDAISQIGIRLPFSRIVTGQPKLWIVVLYYVILAVILLEILKKVRWKLVCLSISFIMLVFQPVRNLQITMLDVGQGDGIFIRGPKGVTCFVDGGSSDVKELGRYRIEPFLKCEGVGRLNYVFISHGDKDHCIGIREMLSRQNVGVFIDNLVLPEDYKQDDSLLELAKLAKRYGTEVKIMRQGNVLEEGKLSVGCLFPENANDYTGNEGSLVLEVQYEDFKMLLTGDIEGEGEKKLESIVSGTHYNILKVAHHGSNFSTTDSFLKHIQADVALISVGKNNSYGHPGKETLARLNENVSKIYTTMESGAITVRVKKREMSVEVFH